MSFNKLDWMYMRFGHQPKELEELNLVENLSRRIMFTCAEAAKTKRPEYRAKLFDQLKRRLDEYKEFLDEAYPLSVSATEEAGQ